MMKLQLPITLNVSNNLQNDLENLQYVIALKLNMSHCLMSTSE